MAYKMTLFEIRPYGKTYNMSDPQSRLVLLNDLNNDGFFKTEWGKQFETTLITPKSEKEAQDFIAAVVDFIKLKYGKHNVVD